MKTWQTPKLIVLVRNNPQEVVLSLCKSYSEGSVGANSALNRCHVSGDDTIGCSNDCLQISVS